jgi:hypothetical protein
MAADEVAMNCEGALERGGSISLIQLYAPGSATSDIAATSSRDGECCYVFHLHAMQLHVKQAAMRQLVCLLESGSTTKVRASGALLHCSLPHCYADTLHLPLTSNSHHCTNCPHPALL